MKRRSLAVLGMVLVLLLPLIGCTVGSYRLSGSMVFGGSSARGSYRSFDGYRARAVRLSEGQRIRVTGEIETENGSLIIKLVEPSGDDLWKVTSGNERFESEMVIPDSGRYWVRVEADDHSGQFNISWDRLQ